MPTLTIPSPLGALTIEERGDAIVAVHWGRAPKEAPTPLLQEAARQLGEYFAGARRDFDLPLNPGGSPLEQAVWAAMARIPYGQTRSYGEIASEVGDTPQSVGSACGSNPIPVIIPCHRVLAAQGRLGGYSGAGGTKTKTTLLVLEGALLV